MKREWRVLVQPVETGSAFNNNSNNKRKPWWTRSNKEKINWSPLDWIGRTFCLFYRSFVLQSSVCEISCILMLIRNKEKWRALFSAMWCEDSPQRGKVHKLGGELVSRKLGWRFLHHLLQLLERRAPRVVREAQDRQLDLRRGEWKQYHTCSSLLCFSPDLFCFYGAWQVWCLNLHIDIHNAKTEN